MKSNEQNPSSRELEKRLISIVPSERQRNHQKLEFYGFFHFSVNTFTDREWGDGTESPSLFHPTNFDAGQWAEAIAAAGMKGAILTCKHHDGFCLWPSRYTNHTVAASPFRNGKGDVVREVSDALRKCGLKFGIYLSPWDRNHPSYGKGKEYDDYFVNQLTELLTGYGDIFCIWLDGACGEGADGRVQRYDWNRYYEVVRRLQPEACIAICGPDVRWCGNEAGDTREQEWSVVPRRIQDQEQIQENSQKSDDETFRERILDTTDQDLGSRAVLKEETELVWFPAEVDLSIRPGWFYHESEDNQVRSLENLVSIYDRSVGGNCTMLLNIPPTREGRLHKNDVTRLKELGDYLRKREARNLAETARRWEGPLSAGASSGCSITLTWDKPVDISLIVLKEDIRFSQRVENFQVIDGDTQNLLYQGKTIGYRKHILPDSLKTSSLRIEILESRSAPVMEFIGVY
ncbi:MAG: alpha-L-fucosidase [Lachnospiraceae bacterium]|nr:alpha-L-fucosidase [Lachnospiraceae bacterium]